MAPEPQYDWSKFRAEADQTSDGYDRSKFYQTARTEPISPRPQYNQRDYGVAAAYAVIVMGVSLAATLVYLRVLRTPAAQQ